jgi:carbon-monoxide dehydrogenase small subunit
MRVTLTVNGNAKDLDLEARRTLADALRDEYGVTSAPVGCSDGTCGTCTVLVDGEAVRSCLILAVQGDGARVLTVEGLPADHPVRRALAADDPAQCTVCVPGLVMLAAAALKDDPAPEELSRLLAGNICRRPGHAAARQAVVRALSCRLGPCSPAPPAAVSRPARSAASPGPRLS